ncbi:glycerophosphodiester phosphodiesterase [Gemella sp. GH3]|uniref:glycerophosphoryl diester phosphodiesterase membrane domain-containing protein n=1 Tax=unclassified Gemella TaxID=2624949 RepID=UPI0015CFBFC9|nr:MULTISPECIES: glycerophosphodiester phosphodiesterase [unclassified Gemella]MBF0714587.1 glycerophosphodiester phosphodiesterase [Gemella sp. GH3.1]NYS51539.1 glycerophosphodiester phosphodiesterase [Gemella sp. GH3]
MKQTTLQLFKEVWSNIYKNKYNYVTNAMLLQFFIVFGGVTILSMIFELILAVSNQTNLTQTSILSILFNPWGLVLILVYILVLSFLMFIEFSVLTINVYGRSVGRYYSAKDFIRNAAKKSKMLVGPQIIFFLLYFVSMVPFANLGLGSILTKDLYIPKFITGELMKTTSGLVVYIILILILLYFNLRLFFVLPLTMINDSNILENIKKSWQLTKKNKLKLLSVIFLFELIFIFILVAVIVILVLLFTYFDSDGNSLLLQSLFFTLLKGIMFSFAALSKIVIITTLVTIIKNYDEIGEDFKVSKEVNYEKSEKKKSKILVVFSVLAIAGVFAVNSLTIYARELNENSIIIGHRGYVKYGVENSIEALEAAKKANANYVEVDILLTKDNKFVVMHDYNLKRLASVNKKVADMTYDEIVGLKIKAGDFESRIPSFEEFVYKAKELDIKLLVELKPHGQEPDNYADLVINKLRELQVEKDYKVMSLDLKVIKEIEQKAPEFNTGYVIPLQLGGFSEKNVDFYVIEDFSFSQEKLSEAKDSGKELYVWTINDKDTIIKYLHSGVDGIITDEIESVQTEKQISKENNNYFYRVINMI